MRKAIITMTVVGALLLILAAAGPHLIPSATYQRIIEESLREGLDARVSIESINFRVIPYPGYTIRGFSLISTRPPFLGMSVVRAEKVVGSLSLSALLRGRIRTGVEMRDAEITYRSQGGISNLGMIFGTREAGGAVEVPEGVYRSMQAPDAAVPAPSPVPAPGAVPEFRAMPVPAIEAPGEGAAPELRSLPPQSGIMRMLLRDALASDGQGFTSGEGKLTITSIDMVRGRVLIDSDNLTQPIQIGSASMAVRNMSSEGGGSADVRFSGAFGGEGSANMSLDARVALDRVRRELRVSRVAAYLNGSQFAADAVVGFGFTPPSIDLHIASPDLIPEAVDPLFAYLGWSLPKVITWRGAIGADISYRGTSDVGELILRLDARRARITAGDGFVKEAGIPFKIAADVVVGGELFSIGESTLSLGSDDLSFTGEIRRDAGLHSKFEISGFGLDASTVKSLVPGLAEVVDLKDVGVELGLAGSLASDAPMDFGGSVQAARAVAAGVEIKDISGSFVRDGDVMTFISVKGSFAEGSVSGNGTVDIGGSPRMEFDVVAHDVEAGDIPSLRGAIAGKAELVANLKSSGSDPYVMEQNLAVSGTLMIPEFSGRAAGAPSKFFEGGIWKEMAQVAKVGIDEGPAVVLEERVSEAKGLRVDFETAEREVVIREASWRAEGYGVKFEASSNAQGSLAGTGEITIDAEIAKGMVPEAASRRVLLGGDGRLIIPVAVSGKLAEPEFEFKGDLFSKRLEESHLRIAKEEAAEAARKALEEAKRAEEEKKKKAAALAAAKARAAALPKPRARPRAGVGTKPAPRRTPITRPLEEDVDDILRVIVGD